MKMMKKMIIFICALIIFSVGTVTFAENSHVIYDGEARNFIFLPGTKESPTDLFTELKNVMPGDELTQEISVKNDENNKNAVKMYLRCSIPQQETEEFLKEMTMKVTQQDEEILYEAPTNETAQLSDWVCLGTLSPGGETTLNLVLDVPIEMGNEFQQKIGYIDWEFKVDEIPVPEPTPQDQPETPNTGIQSNMMIWLLAGGLLFIAAMMIIKKTYRTKGKN